MPKERHMHTPPRQKYKFWKEKVFPSLQPAGVCAFTANGLILSSVIAITLSFISLLFPRGEKIMLQNGSSV